jgi:hypothetical protein
MPELQRSPLHGLNLSAIDHEGPTIEPDHRDLPLFGHSKESCLAE